MVNDTTLLLDLDGVSVMRVERLQCGGRRVHLATADASARACPACGVFASRVKGWATTRPRDLPYGESGLEFVWHKRRWWCRETACPRRSLREQIEQIPAGARITGRLRSASGRRVRDGGSTVIQTARDMHLSWPTVMNAFRTAAREVVGAPLLEVEVLGIDETRRGRTRWEQDPDTEKWKMTRDRWHTGFVDALGSGGLLGQVEGRTVADVLAWLSTTPLTWRKAIRYVAIDMSAIYRSAIRTGLPEATVVVDHFMWYNSRTRCSPWSGAAGPPRSAAGADAPVTPSGKPDAACSATAKTLTASSSSACGTRCWTKGRSDSRC